LRDLPALLGSELIRPRSAALEAATAAKQDGGNVAAIFRKRRINRFACGEVRNELGKLVRIARTP
jgi:hypothetical protein